MSLIEACPTTSLHESFIGQSHYSYRSPYRGMEGASDRLCNVRWT
jgi:hypothetical protein